MMPRRGKSKFYGVRVGRQIGVFDSWDKCRSMVDGVKNSEFRSFPTHAEAAKWVSMAWRDRRLNMMNLRTCPAVKMCLRPRIRWNLLGDSMDGNPKATATKIRRFYAFAKNVTMHDRSWSERANSLNH